MRQVVADQPPVVALWSSVRSRTTRSSKARVRLPIHTLSSPDLLIPPPPQLLSDPTENTQQLTHQLRALGLYAADTLGDGNCLFRALSDQLYGTPSYHSALRQDICDWIAAHKTRYEPFVEDERGFDVHLQCMRQQGSSTFFPPCAVQLTFCPRNLWRTSGTLCLCPLCTTRRESDTTRLGLRDRVVRRLGSLRDRRHFGPLFRRASFPCRQQRETSDETGQSPRRSGEDRTSSRGYVRPTTTDLRRVSDILRGPFSDPSIESWAQSKFLGTMIGNTSRRSVTSKVPTLGSPM
jgi:hypothetical protein